MFQCNKYPVKKEQIVQDYHGIIEKLVAPPLTCPEINTSPSQTSVSSMSLVQDMVLSCFELCSGSSDAKKSIGMDGCQSSAPVMN